MVYLFSVVPQHTTPSTIERVYKAILHVTEYSPETKANVQINAIDPIARPFVETYRNGKHIAYHRSSDMNVNVNTDTVTDTVCGKE